MGLSFPVQSVVYVDTNAVIYTVERIAPYFPLLDPLWTAARRGEIHVISSDLLIVETLPGPLRAGDAAMEAIYRRVLFASTDLELVPISHAILEAAAQLRSLSGIRTPDAIHAATALSRGADIFVTNDRGFRRVAGLPVTVLADLIP